MVNYSSFRSHSYRIAREFLEPLEPKADTPVTIDVCSGGAVAMHVTTRDGVSRLSSVRHDRETVVNALCAALQAAFDLGVYEVLVGGRGQSPALMEHVASVFQVSRHVDGFVVRRKYGAVSEPAPSPASATTAQSQPDFREVYNATRALIAGQLQAGDVGASVDFDAHKGEVRFVYSTSGSARTLTAIQTWLVSTSTIVSTMRACALAALDAGLDRVEVSYLSPWLTAEVVQSMPGVTRVGHQVMRAPR